MQQRRRRLAALVAMLTGLAALGVTATSAGATHREPRVCERWSDPDAGPPAPRGRARGIGSTALADRCLRLNDLQSIGSHNSYHRQPEEPLWSALQAFDAGLARSIEYTHSPLPEQLAGEGVRQIELDVFADPDGGYYDQRRLLPLLGLPADSGVPELEAPGFKVLHIQEVDFLSSCWTFVQCLEQVKGWSDANPRHVPVAILVELKDDPIPDPLGVGFVPPVPIGPAELDALDAEIRSVFPPDRVISPDDVRGSHATLEAAVLADGWPRLGAARGQVVFLMDNGGRYRSDYLAGRPNLEGRVLFTNASPGDADAAFVKRNDPLTDGEEIRSLVRAGYVVRTRADADTEQARTGDTTQRDAALASGAQWVSTDYPVPGRAAPLGSDYVAQLPEGAVARCNPVGTGPACRDRALAREGR